jgi:hypothetical protein
MITAQLSDGSRGESGQGLGSYTFLVLPRIGEILVLQQKNETTNYEVVNLTHIIFNKAKPPLINIIVHQDTSAPAFRPDDIEAMFSGED